MPKIPKMPKMPKMPKIPKNKLMPKYFVGKNAPMEKSQKIPKYATKMSWQKRPNGQKLGFRPQNRA